jgi:hypothetical protein
MGPEEGTCNESGKHVALLLRRRMDRWKTQPLKEAERLGSVDLIAAHGPPLMYVILSGHEGGLVKQVQGQGQHVVGGQEGGEGHLQQRGQGGGRARGGGRRGAHGVESNLPTANGLARPVIWNTRGIGFVHTALASYKGLQRTEAQDVPNNTEYCLIYDVPAL